MTTKYLVFTSRSAANAANTQIGSNMGCPIIGISPATGMPDPSAQQTIQWASPVQRLDGKWIFPKPDDSFMTGVTNYTSATFDPSWFPASSMGS